VIALSVLFIAPTWWLVPFVAVSVGLIVVMPRLDRWFFTCYGDRVIEPEIKGAFAALLVLMWLGDQAHSQAVLPAFVLGLAVSRTLARHRATQQRFRVVAFALLTPLFFLRSGMNVSLPLVVANLGLLGTLLAVKLTVKSAAVYPLARRYATPHATFTTLLMSTGLTFGTIAATYGFSTGLIDRAQFSILVTVVVVTAVVPTAVAQRFFAPETTGKTQVGESAVERAGVDLEPSHRCAPGLRRRRARTPRRWIDYSWLSVTGGGARRTRTVIRSAGGQQSLPVIPRGMPAVGYSSR
jgi:Kef-type K+ transport system membrane component KefB